MGLAQSIANLAVGIGKATTPWYGIGSAAAQTVGGFQFDQTNANIGTEIVQSEKPDWQKELEMRWEREDQIRKETQEREDNAVRRWAEDMRLSGLNPNLVNTQGAASGGGITNASTPDYTMTEAEYNKSMELLMQEIEQNWKGDQNEKDRIKEFIKSLIQGGALLGAAGLKASGK